MGTQNEKSDSLFVIRSAEGGRTPRRAITPKEYREQREKLARNGIPHIKPVTPNI